MISVATHAPITVDPPLHVPSQADRHLYMEKFIFAFEPRNSRDLFWAPSSWNLPIHRSVPWSAGFPSAVFIFPEPIRAPVTRGNSHCNVSVGKIIARLRYCFESTYLNIFHDKLPCNRYEMPRSVTGLVVFLQCLKYSFRTSMIWFQSNPQWMRV